MNRLIANRLRSAFLLAGILAVPLAGCGSSAGDIGGLTSFRIQILKVDQKDPPTVDAPLPANIGKNDEAWDFTLQAVDAYDQPTAFEGFVRMRVEPGAVTGVQSDGAVGRNVLLKGGRAEGTAMVTSMYGPARLWVEDMGYVPADLDKPPACADGIDNDGDGRIDYPADPGCAFADDDTEEGGSSAAGVSAPVHYALPRIADVQGTGTATPYPFQGIQVGTGDPQYVIVTRVASDGFYVTDLKGPPGGSNSLYAFNFNTPAGMRVCDRLVYLSGTMSEFFGFTELGFPSYDVTFIKEGQGDCEVPDPTPLDVDTQNNPIRMETLESSLVRIEKYKISDHFGPDLAINNVFKENQSNCDYNGDGAVDFTTDSPEGKCANACSSLPDCSEWTGYSARGNYKVYSGATKIQVNTQSVAGFDPPSFRGKELTAVTGTLRNFSGGSDNWTIETRCTDDLVCASPSCADKILPSTQACVRLRTTDDPDEGTN